MGFFCSGIFSVAISVSPHVCHVLVFILISMLLRLCIYKQGTFHANRVRLACDHLYGEIAVHLAVAGDVFNGVFLCCPFFPRDVLDEIWDFLPTLN